MRRKSVIFFGATLLFCTIAYMVLNPNTDIYSDIMATGKDMMRMQTVLSKAKQWNAVRKKRIKDYCDKLAKNRNLTEVVSSWKKIGVHNRPRMYFSDNARLVFCETPKCGTTQWRNLLLILDGHLKGYDTSPDTDLFQLSWEHSFMWTKFNPSNSTHAAAVEEKLKSYFKIMTTRDPLERLVSAYRDKLETGENDKYYKPVSKNIHKAVTKDTKTIGQLATFEEFIDYILSKKRRIDLDPHWKPYSELCDPCSVNYDYIARMETVYDDATYITKQIDVQRHRIYNSSGRSGAQERRNQLFYEYFENLPSTKRYAIFNYYKDQYDMFGYEYPKFINTSLIT